MITALCYAIIFVFSINAQLFPSILTRVQGSAVEQGILLSSLYLLYPITSAGAGYAADRIGKRTVLLLGAAAMGAPFIIAAFTANIWTWIAAVLLFGVGSGILEGQASALVSDVNPGRERRVLNTSQLFYSIGATGGPFLIALTFNVRPDTSLSAILLAAAATSFLLLIWIALSRSPHSFAPSPSPMPLKGLLKDPTWRLLCLAIFLYVAVEAGTVGWLAKYSHETLGMSEALSPVAIGLFWAGLGVSRAAVGLIDLPFQDRTIVLTATAAALVVHCAAYLVSNAAAALALFFCIGFCWGTVWPTLVSIVGRRFKRSSGAAIGIMVASGAAAIPVIQLVVGALSSNPAIGMRGAMLSLSVLIAANLIVIRRAVIREPSGV